MNGHNFYLSEDEIRKADIDSIKKSYKQGRTELKLFQFQKMKEEEYTNKLVDLDELASKQYSADVWCAKCFDYYNQCSVIASQCALKVIGGLYSHHVILCC